MGQTMRKLAEVSVEFKEGTPAAEIVKRCAVLMKGAGAVYHPPFWVWLDSSGNLHTILGDFIRYVNEATGTERPICYTAHHQVMTSRMVRYSI